MKREKEVELRRAAKLVLTKLKKLNFSEGEEFVLETAQSQTLTVLHKLQEELEVWSFER